MGTDSAIHRVERLPSVLERTGLSRSALYEAIAKGGFPQQLKLSSRTIGFLSAEVDDWIAKRAAARGRALG